MSNSATIFKKISILFVEDEDSLRKTIDNAMGTLFDKFIAARDGEDGIKKFKKYKPDIVITDLFMPIKDGLTLTKEIKALSKDTPVVVLSAFSDKDKLLGAIDAGVDKYLIKPVTPDGLLQTIEIIAKDKFSMGNVVEIGKGYKYDKNRQVLIKDTSIISLTKKEIVFISFLVKHLGAFVLHEDIKRAVWPNGRASDSATRTFVKRIREKTDKDFIKNVPGLGYEINRDIIEK